MTGLIALDIDGTITIESRTIPDEVVRYLALLQAEGWVIALVTGRTFNQCEKLVSCLPFSYFLAVQNGAILLSMPERRVISRHYLDKETLQTMSKISMDHFHDVVVYSGYEHGDRCFYRPHAFCEELLAYTARRCEEYGELWEPLDSFERLPLETFASTKSFGAYEPLEPLSVLFKDRLKLHAPINRDPFEVGYFVMQTTHPLVNKGQAVRDVKVYSGSSGLTIAAGDDCNDIELLSAADIAIAMGDSPVALHKYATIIAPPASELGIIQGLNQAIKEKEKP